MRIVWRKAIDRRRSVRTWLERFGVSSSDDRPMEFAAADPAPDAVLISRELEIAIAQVVKALPRQAARSVSSRRQRRSSLRRDRNAAGHSAWHGEVAHLRSAPPDPDEARSPRSWRSAMNTNHRDRLDDAIDHVVTRMVRVDENDALASQIINALPERASWFGWLFHSWAPRLAMIAIVVVAGIAWGNRKPATTPQLDPLASTLTVPRPVEFVASVREARTQQNDAFGTLGTFGTDEDLRRISIAVSRRSRRRESWLSSR